MSGYIDYPETSGAVSSAPPVPFDPGPPFVHPQAYVHETAQLGRGTKVWQFASVMAGAVIGENCAIGPCAFVGVGARLGNHVRMQHMGHVTDHMVVGSYVFWGHAALTANDAHPKVNNPGFYRDPPTVKDHVSLGMGCMINPGVTLGEGCVIGAGAMVTKDVEPYTTVISPIAARPRALAAPEESTFGSFTTPQRPGWTVRQ